LTIRATKPDQNPRDRRADQDSPAGPGRVLAEARGIWPDEAGHEEPDPLLQAGMPVIAMAVCSGSVTPQGADRHDGGKSVSGRSHERGTRQCDAGREWT